MAFWIYIASEWIIRVVMTPVVLRHRRQSAALAWLLVIFVFPWGGLVLYSLVGSPRLGRRRARRTARAQRVVAQLGKLAITAPHIVHPDVSPRLRGLVAVGERVGDSPILGGNTVEYLSNTGEAMERLIADIDAATHSVNILVYIYQPDETGERVAAALIRAARRGVKARVLADDVGSVYMVRGRLSREMRAAGVEVLRLLPANWARIALARLDLRNHRKLYIIDGKIAYAGSHNIVNADYGLKKRPWEDASVRMTGPVVLQCQQVILEDWYAETGVALDEAALFPAPQATGTTSVQIVPSGPDRPNQLMRDVVITAIQEAERRVVITSPYLTLDESVYGALRVAVLRNVRVDLVIPARGNNPIVAAVGWSYARDLASVGVNVHLHQGGLLHAKTMTVDDSFAMIGSSNFDVRSFELNFELNVLIYDRASAAELVGLQSVYILNSTLIDEDWIRNRGGLKRLWDDLCRLISPLL